MVAVYPPGYGNTSAGPPLTAAQLEDPASTTSGYITGAALQEALDAEEIPVTPAVANGQTTFTLATAPLRPAAVRMFVNGVEYRTPSISVSGATVTWAGGFSLGASDKVEIYT